MSLTPEQAATDAPAPGVSAGGSSPPAVGKLERVALREVWKHEALDFTRWLQENVDVLSDVLGLNLDNVEREQSAGTFSVDLVAEDEAGNPIVIENQLEKSNHDHLGKLITYLTAVEAKTAVWIVSEPRPEHVRAIGWLNESSAASFYLLKVEAIRIGVSPPAPLLTLIVGPSPESRQAGAAKQEIAERYDLRRAFWTGLLERAKTRTKLHASISPGKSNYIVTGAGRSGLIYSYSIHKHGSQIELYIDKGPDSDSENAAIFDALHARRQAIETSFGEALGWQRLDGKRACRIAKTLHSGGYRNPEEDWPGIQDEMIDVMVRLEGALRGPIASLTL